MRKCIATIWYVILLNSQISEASATKSYIQVGVISPDDAITDVTQASQLGYELSIFPNTLECLTNKL